MQYYLDRLREACLKLRREQYYDKLPVCQFEELPAEINQRIHYYRDADDFSSLSKKQMEAVLGLDGSERQRKKLVRRMLWRPHDDFTKELKPWWMDDYIITGILLSLYFSRRHTIDYSTLSPTLRMSPQLLILSAIYGRDKQALLFADDSLRNSRTVCLAYLGHRGPENYSPYADLLPKFRDDRSFNLELIKKRPSYISNLGEAMRDDKEIALLAVTKYPRALQHLSDRLKDDNEIVLIATKDHDEGWRLLEHASMRLQIEHQYSAKFAENQAEKAKRQEASEKAKRDKQGKERSGLASPVIYRQGHYAVVDHFGLDTFRFRVRSARIGLCFPE